MAELNRRAFLKNAGLAATGVGAVLAGCAKTGTAASGPGINLNQVHQWQMVTTWSAGSKVLHEGAVLLAQWIEEMSAGRIKIHVYGAGELVPAYGAFGAVREGAADIGHGASYYWAGQVPASPFFSSVPFGMNAQQVNAWLATGGGIELWTELYRDLGVIPFVAGNTGVQMGGWFNREITGIDDLKGLKMRIPGFGGSVMAKAGVAVVTTAPAEIYTSLERGVIDAAEFVGPCHDYLLSLHRIAKYYYYPGWQEPGSVLEVIINRQKFEALSPDLQAIVRAACERSNTWYLTQFDNLNSQYLKLIRSERGDAVKILPFPAPVLAALRGYSDEVIAELVASDAMARRINDSYRKFQALVAPWSEISEKSYYSMLQKG